VGISPQRLVTVFYRFNTTTLTHSLEAVGLSDGKQADDKQTEGPSPDVNQADVDQADVDQAEKPAEKVIIIITDKDGTFGKIQDFDWLSHGVFIVHPNQNVRFSKNNRLKEVLPSIISG
jgi:hypothetical protein